MLFFESVLVATLGQQNMLKGLEGLCRETNMIKTTVYCVTVDVADEDWVGAKEGVDECCRVGSAD